MVSRVGLFLGGGGVGLWSWPFFFEELASGVGLFFVWRSWPLELAFFSFPVELASGVGLFFFCHQDGVAANAGAGAGDVDVDGAGAGAGDGDVNSDDYGDEDGDGTIDIEGDGKGD